MSPSQAHRLRYRLTKIAGTMTQLSDIEYIQFPDHSDKTRIEAEFAKTAKTIHKLLGWMDDRLTEKIIYATKEAQK